MQDQTRKTNTPPFPSSLAHGLALAWGPRWPSQPLSTKATNLARFAELWTLSEKMVGLESLKA
jgi:hypothetical protein